MAAGGTALFRQLHWHPFPFVAGAVQQRNHRRSNQKGRLPFRHVQSEPIQGSHGQTVANERGYKADYGLRGTHADQVPQTVPATGKGLVPVQLPVVRHQSDRHFCTSAMQTSWTNGWLSIVRKQVNSCRSNSNLPPSTSSTSTANRTHIRRITFSLF